MNSGTDYDWRIQGIPCIVEVLSCTHLEDEGFGSLYELDYLILDRKGYRADWLWRKMTAQDRDDLEQQIILWRA